MIDKKLLSILGNSPNIEQMLEKTPQPAKPIVTLSDADVGFITRYFIRQVNDTTFILEIDPTQYRQFKNNPRFILTDVQWKIVGKLDTIYYPNGTPIYGIKDLNRIAVANTDLTFGGLRDYITDYGEFWLREN